MWHSTRAVDRISVLLVILMGLSFAFGISGLSMNVRLDLLLDRVGSEVIRPLCPGDAAGGAHLVRLPPFGLLHARLLR